MWNRVLGLSNEKHESSSSSSGRRKDDDEKRPERKRTSSSRKSSGIEEKDRGIGATPNSYSSISGAPYSEVAPASVASSYVTAQTNNTDQTISLPQQLGNVKLTNEMSTSQSRREEYKRDDDREREKARKRDRSTSRNRKEDRQNRSRSRDREERRRDRKERRERRQERAAHNDTGLRISESEHQKTNRSGGAVSGSGNSSAHVGGSGFTQFPGQFDGGVPGFPSEPAHPPHMSDHVPDQFPGQFPTGSSAPYRPPLSIEEGGPGLAADYYGDAGESVATQPGVRPQAPTLIVGAQPHLMAASPIEAPPVEPSSTGGVGAAASFFSGATFESPSGTPKLNQPLGRPTGIPSGVPPQPPYSSQPSNFAVPSALVRTAALGYIASTHQQISQGSAQGPAGSFPPQTSTRPPPNIYPTASIAPNNNNHSSSAPVIPTLGSTVVGAAAGYMIGSHTSQQQPINSPVPVQGSPSYTPYNGQNPSQQTNAPHGSYPGYNRPSQPGKQSPSSSNLPLYAAGALGAAGIAAAAYQHEHHEHHDSAQNSYTGQAQASAFMPQSHRHRGPLSKFVDFFRDPEGVAQFEEYTEYIGVCRYCFAPGSSPREAPRKHYYRRKRSNERLGASIRVDKESRYSSSDGESRRRNKNTSWIASGIVGMGLAKVGESLFASNQDFDDTYSVRSGHANQSTASISNVRHNSSPHQKTSVSYGVVAEPSNIHSTYDQIRRSASKDHDTGIGEAAIVAAMGAASIAGSSSRKCSRSPRGNFVKNKSRSTEHDYDYGNERIRKDRTGLPLASTYVEVTPRQNHKEKGRDSKKKKKKTGFFNFANSSSSDTGLVTQTGSDRSKAKKSSRAKIKDHNDANAALIGLGAAAAALAVADGRKSDKGKRRSDIIAIKEVKVKDGRKSEDRRFNSQKPVYPNIDEAQWESASEEIGYSSVDSALAYGVSRRKSNDSLRSDSSGTEKWSWRWGSGSKRKYKPKYESRSTGTIFGSATGLAGASVEASIYANEDARHAARSSNSSLPPLQHVYPVATSDPSNYDVTRHDSVTSGNQPMRTSRAAAIPLQQPQPVMPVSSVIYTAQVPYEHSYSAPAGPPVFSQPLQPSSFVPGYGLYNGSVDVRQGILPIQHPQEQAFVAAVPQVAAIEHKLQRRESLPTPHVIYIEPKQPKRSSTRDDISAVRFDLTEEQRNKEARDREHERERERENSDFLARERELHHVNRDVEDDGKPQRSKKNSRSNDNTTRDEQTNSELKSFRKVEETPTKQNNSSAWVTPALVGVAGAVVGAAAAEQVKSENDRRDARKNAKSDEYEDPHFNKNDKSKHVPEVEDEERVSHDERQKVLAKKAAALVNRTPSPAHQDYSSFFAPTEFLSKSNMKAIVDDSNGGNDITSYQIPEIVTNETFDQRGSPSSVPYTFPGTGKVGDNDPNFMRLPWQVPRLNLIKPTPPASMAGSVRGDASPILRPEDAHPSDSEEQKQSEKESKRVKVTFGDSETHEYEVITPDDHHDEFIRDLSEVQTTGQEKSMDQGVLIASNQSMDSLVKEVTRDHMLGDFGDDLDFAATLAAGLQGSGFDPAIVIDDPTYRRRDSPPGSEDRESYRRPFFETVEDLSLDSPSTGGAPPQRGFVDGELPPTPKDEFSAESVRPSENGKENSKMLLTEAKTAMGSNDNVEMLQQDDGFQELLHDAEVPQVIEVLPRTVLDDYSGSPVDQRPHVNESSSDTTDDKDEFQDASESASIDHEINAMPDVRAEAGDTLEVEANVISTNKGNKKSKARGKIQGQDIYDVPEGNIVSNTAIAPLPEDSEDQKRSRKKSKRKKRDYNDADSGTSSPASFENEKELNTKLVNSSVAPISSVMELASQSADQNMEREPKKPRETTLDDFEEPKKKGKKSKGGKYKADEDWFKVEAPELTPELSKVEEEKGRQAQKSSSKRDKRKKNGRKNGNEDSGMVTQGIPAENGDFIEEKDTVLLRDLDNPDPNRGIRRSSELDQPLSFLGIRRKVTEPPDISSMHDLGSTVRRISSEETFRDAIRSKIIEQGLPPLPASRPTSPTAVGSTGDLPSLPPSRTTSPIATPSGKRRRLSMLQLAESNLGGSSPSPTAVPLMFRRFPSSTGVSRSNPSSPGQSPRTAVPFSPRQRQGRPLSTEFKSSTEFRPLWLVERHNPSRRGQGPEVAEEVYPSLPSSHSTSRASSVHDSDFKDSDEIHGSNDFDQSIIAPQEIPFSVVHNSEYTDDFLGSQQATPTRDSFLNELETRSIDPMQDLPCQSVRSSPPENTQNLELFEHEKYHLDSLPSLPRSRDSSPYEETVSRNNSSITRGVVLGAMATGSLATILDVGSRSDQDYDLDQAPVGKEEPGDSIQLLNVKRSMSEPASIVSCDDLEISTNIKSKKEKDKKQRKFKTTAAGEEGVSNDMPLLGTAGLDRQLQNVQAEDSPTIEVAPVQNETYATRSLSTPSKKSKKDKRDKVKSKSNIDTPDVDNSQPDVIDEVYIQGQQYESGLDHTEPQPQLDKELPRRSAATIGSLVVAAPLKDEAVLNAGNSNHAAPFTPPLEDSDWPDFSAKSMKGKKQKAKKTSAISEEQLPVVPSSVQEVEDIYSGTRDYGNVKEEDLFIVPSRKMPEKAKENQISNHTEELAKIPTTETDQSSRAVVPKDMDMDTSISEIPGNVDREILPEPGKISGERSALEPMHIQSVSPEAIALPADDDLDLLPALPPDSPLSNPQSGFDLMVEERSFLQEPTSINGLSYNSGIVSEFLLPIDIMTIPTHDMEASPRGESGSFVESSRTQQVSTENSHHQNSHKETAIEANEPPVMRGIAPESSDLEQSVDLEPGYLSEGAVKPEEFQASCSPAPQLKPVTIHSIEEIENAIDLETPTADTITEPFLTSVDETPTPYEEPPTSMYFTPAQEKEITDGYFDNVRDENKEVRFPTLFKGKKSKKNRKSQPVTPLEEPFLAERSIMDLSDEVSASISKRSPNENSKEASSAVIESATDEWATSSKKKGKKGRKSQPVTFFEEPSVAELPTVSTPSDNPVLAQELISDTAFEEPAIGATAAMDEWATTSKPRGKKGKKKNVVYEEADPRRDDQKEVKDIADVRDFGDAGQRSLETSSEITAQQIDSKEKEKLPEHETGYFTTATEFPLAATDTAKEVSNMLDSTKDDSAMDVGRSDARDNYQKMPGEPEAQISFEVIDHEESDWPAYAKKSSKKSKETKISIAASLANVDLVEDGKREKDYPVATTDTAAEVRGMLTSTDDVGSIALAQEENRFSDERFSGFAKKKNGKKGKKTTPPSFSDPIPLKDIALTTIPDIDVASLENITKEARSADVFSMPKPKKNKSQPKSISRSISDYEDAPDFSGVVTESAVDPKSISHKPMAGQPQKSLVDEAASVQLPSPEADELLEEEVPDEKPTLAPLEDPLPRIDTISVEEASKIALPTDDMEELEEREEKSTVTTHASKHEPDYNFLKSDSENISRPPFTKTPNTELLVEANLVPMPEDLESGFTASSGLDRERVSSTAEFPTHLPEVSDAFPSQSNIDKPMQVTNGIPYGQSSATLYAEEDAGPIGHDSYSKESMVSEHHGEEETPQNVQLTLEHSRSELEESPVVHMGAPLLLADQVFEPLEDKVDVQPASQSFAGQAEETGTTYDEKTAASPAFVERNNPLVDDADFLRFNETEKDKEKTISSASYRIEEPAPESYPERLTTEPARPSSTSKEMQANRAVEPESITSIDNEGFFASKEGKKEKQQKISSFQSWEDAPAQQAVEEPLAEEPTEPGPILRDQVDPSPPDLPPTIAIEADGMPTPKKAKKDKKNRKSSKLNSTREPSPLPETDQEVGITPVYNYVETGAEEPELSSHLTVDEQVIATGEDTLFDLPKGKKGKKKSKRSQAPDWTDEPADTVTPRSVDTSTSAIDTMKALPTNLEVLPLMTTEEQIVTTNEDDNFDLPEGKKSKKKSKQSQALDLLDKTATPPARIDPELIIPTFTAEASFTERIEPLTLTAKEQPIITSNEDDQFRPPRGKKGKSKSKKSQPMDWDNEPSNITTPADSRLENDASPVVLQVSGLEQTKSQSPVQEPEPASFGLKRSKRDKKKTKKGARFAWDEDQTQQSNQFEDDPTTTESSEIPLDRDIVQPELEEVTTHESHEDTIGDVLDSSEYVLGFPTKLSGHDALERNLLLRDKSDDQEAYPAFGLEEGVVGKPDDIRISAPVEEPEDIIERGAVQEPRDGFTLQDFNERHQDNHQQEVSHELGDIQVPQGIGSDHGIGAIHELIANSETMEALQPGPASEQESVLRRRFSGEPESGFNLASVKDTELPHHKQSFDLPPQSLPEPEEIQESSPVHAELPDIVEPQQDEVFLPSQTKKKKKKGKGSGQVTPSSLETQEEPTPLVDEEPPLTLEETGLDREREREEEQRSQSLEGSFKDVVFIENDASAAATSLISQPERAKDTCKSDTNEIPIIEDEFSGFTTKKKNKKGKKSQEAAESLSEDPFTQPANLFEEGAVGPVTEERNQSSVEVSSHAPERTTDSFEVSTQNTPVAEDDFVGYASKKKGKKSKKPRQSEIPVYEEPDMETQTLTPLLSEANGGASDELPVYEAERTEDIPTANIQNDSFQDDDFVGFATKKKKEKKFKQSAAPVFKEPVPEIADKGPERLEEDREAVEDPSQHKQDNNLDMLYARTQDEPAVEDDFEGFATKKGKKGKKGKKSSQARVIDFEEPRTIPEELQVPITATEEAFPEVVEPYAKSAELPTVTEGVSIPLKSTLSGQQEDDWSDFKTMERKTSKNSKKSKKEQPVTPEDETTTYESDEFAQKQDDRTDGQPKKPLETTETSKRHIERDVSQPTYLVEDNQLAAIPTVVSDLVKQNDLSSMELRAEASDISTINDPPKHKERIGDYMLQGPLMLDTSQIADSSITEAAPERNLQSARVYDESSLGPLAAVNEREAFADLKASGEPEFSRPKESEKSKKGRGDSTFVDNSISTSTSLASPFKLAGTIEEAPFLYPETLPPGQFAGSDSDRKDDLDRESGAVTIEDSLSQTQTPQGEPGILEDLSRRQTEEARQEAVASEPNPEEFRELPTTKKGKKGKKSKKQYLDLEPTSSTSDVQQDQSISGKDLNMTELAEEAITFQKDSSLSDVPLAPTQDAREHEKDQEYSRSHESELVSQPRQSKNTVKPSVTTTAVGAGIALFEDLVRRDSVAASKKDKKGKKKSDQSTHQENQEQGESILEQSSGLPNTTEFHESLDSSHFSDGQAWAPSPQYEEMRNRDSAIQVAESPMPGAKSPLHYSIRDSGYQGTDASPTLQEILALPRQNRFSNESTLRGIEQNFSPVHDYDTDSVERRTAIQFPENSHNPLNISIEVDPAYDVSISRPAQEQVTRREASQGRSRELDVELPVSYTEDYEHHELSTTASPIRHHDDRQPSPVDSTTRDRSSVLFQSSPSTREDNIHTRSLDLATEDTSEHTKHPEMAQYLGERSSPARTSNRPEGSTTRNIDSTEGIQSSLFGGPVGINSDSHTITSPPGTPISSGRRQLKSMSVAGLDDSPLQGKAQRILDRGMQEASLRGTQRSVAPQRHSQQRGRSPLGNYTEGKEPRSTNDIISRLSWSIADEEKHVGDPDRSKSRNIDTTQRSSSHHSPLSALAMDMAKQREPDFRSTSGASIRSGESISAYIRSPEIQSPATPPLRRVDRSVSGDLRAANKRGDASPLAKPAESALDSEPGFASSSTYDPVKDKGKQRITKMTDVYEGWGDVHGSPRSPTRPPSMRKRQSMQLLDLETRIDQLVSENRLLQDAKARADRQLGDAVEDHSQQKSAFDDAIRTRDLYVQQKNSELNKLRGILDGLQSEVSRLTEINQGLSGSTRELTSDHEQRYGQLEDDHADIHQKWQESTRELEELRHQHASLSAGMEEIVRHEVDLALDSKDVELQQMRNELETAKDQVRRLQQQILASRSSDDIIVTRDEDYFDSQCQQLCQHVQQWVLRFSKFSDMKTCLSIDAVAEVRISDRFDNAILDGSDVDIYLADRIKRRDVFMSVVMTMVWEYIFQRYLFGLDREQRQKLKSLEKTLLEVGPPRAVNRWRATTLTMLSRRTSFLPQRQQDTEAVVNEIFDTLAALLPPPGHLVGQITDSLRKVMSAAADLAVEMRCQLCEYLMPPPLQPEYDTHGDLARQVFFNPALMNERSGATASNDALGAQRAIVRLVLFPLVLKRGDDGGDGDEEIVVCPAQVLVARESEPRSTGGKKSVRVVSAQSQRPEARTASAQSGQSFAPSSMDAGMGGRF